LQAGRPLLQAGRPLLQAGRPLLQAGRPLLQAGRPLLRAGRPLLRAGSPLLQAALVARHGGPPAADRRPARPAADHQHPDALNDRFDTVAVTAALLLMTAVAADSHRRCGPRSLTPARRACRYRRR
jgi:hypothetical protein